ncbi:WD40 repeat [Tessaracoccus bendigoensis DSM 12906]|uniref:WD40 repeat n=1 Tax=Tessaracoccus bendigoensis DSM 12906 TaxID=1123357 RepID=A0A1M6EHP6_9ACTN|nr:helix-turn-helix domain-containing protein [Tessaracoccus bendigoensis]SHI84994.1 WD40 repeat [Tessaracoccus bendigoensis DSM 12906]
MQLPGTRERLVDALGAARKARGISIRSASALIGLPPSTIQGWFEGKHLPTQALTPKFLDLLTHLGLAASDEDRRLWADALAAIRSVRQVSESPYAGLNPYSAEQARLYFGRERSLGKLVDACLRPSDDETSRIIILLGESGSGKSSLLAAGLIGRETSRGGALSHLKPVQVAPAGIAAQELTSAPTLLVIDQFEDLDQLPPEEQQAAMERLGTLPENTICVLGLRADAIGLAMRHEWLAQDLTTPVVLGPIPEDAFVRIIERPALQHGRAVAPELTQLLIRDIYAYGEPAPGVVLPLLSNALRRCWEESKGATLTPADYLATGGLWAALNQEADAIFDRFSPAEQKTARRLLLSLFNVDGAAALRRRIPVSALTPEMAEVSEPFVASRILARVDDHLMVAHDALLLHWHRLASWVEAAQTTLLLGRRIHLAAQLWDEGGRTNDTLMPAEAQLWRAWADSDEATVLSATEHAFIDASCELGEATVVEQRRTIARMRVRQYVALVAGGLALAMSVVTIAASARSEDFRRQGEAATRAAQSRQVALISDEVRGSSPNVAGQLSVASRRLDDNVQSRSSLLTSVAANPPIRATGPSGNTMLATSATGRLIVRGDSEGKLSIWRDGDIRLTPQSLASGGGQLFSLSLRETGSRILLLVAGQKTAAVWDITGQPEKLIDSGEKTVGYSTTWQGDTALIGTLDGQIHRFDLTDPSRPLRLPDLQLGEETQVTALAASGSWILAGGRRDRIEVFADDGTARGPLTTSGTVRALTTSPDEATFVSGSSRGEATIWDATTLGKKRSQTTTTAINAVAYQGDVLWLAGSFGAVEAYSASGLLLRTLPGRSIVTSVVPAGDNILTGSTEGDTSFWSAPGDVVLASAQGVSHYDVIRSTNGLLIGTDTGAVMMAFTDGRWTELPLAPAPDGSGYNPYYAIDLEGDTVVNQTNDGSLVTFTRTDGHYEVAGEQPMPTGMADIQLSPDGSQLAVAYQGQAGYRLYTESDAGWVLNSTLNAWPGRSAFSDDGALFAAMSVDGKQFGLWSMAGDVPEELVIHPTSEDTVPVSFTFAPDGTLAVSDDGGWITLYDVSAPDTPEPIHRLGDARGALSQIQFTEDGSQLLASSRAGELWVWSKTDSGWPLDLMLRPGGPNVTGVDSYAGWYVMSLDNGTTVAWEDDPATARNQLCRSFGSALSPAEWERLVPGVPFIDGCKKA